MSKSSRPSNKDSLGQRVEGVNNTVGPLIYIPAVVIAIAVGVFGFYQWVDHIARQAVLNGEFVRELAIRVRPMCIFNSRETITVDLGAGKYVKDIEVVPRPEVGGFRISIEMNSHIAYPPLISAADVDLFPVNTARGEMHTWVFEMSPSTTRYPIEAEQGPNFTNRIYHFKLEILQ